MTAREAVGSRRSGATFAYMYFMRAEPERVGSVAARHAAYWQGRALPGYAGGPFADRSGGLIVFESASRAEAVAAVAADPFVTEGLVGRSWIKEWRPE